QLEQFAAGRSAGACGQRGGDGLRADPVDGFSVRIAAERTIVRFQPRSREREIGLAPRAAGVFIAHPVAREAERLLAGRTAEFGRLLQDRPASSGRQRADGFMMVVTTDAVAV